MITSEHPVAVGFWEYWYSLLTSVSNASKSNSFCENWCLNGGLLLILILNAFFLATSESTVFSLVDCLIALTVSKALKESKLSLWLMRIFLTAAFPSVSVVSAPLFLILVLWALSNDVVFFFFAAGSLYLFKLLLLFWKQHQ